MKFTTPAPLDAESGFPLLEKGGDCIMRGGGMGLRRPAYPTRPQAQVSHTGTASCSSSWFNVQLSQGNQPLQQKHLAVSSVSRLMNFSGTSAHPMLML